MGGLRARVRRPHLFAVALLCLLGLGQPGTAEAHASVREIVPADGALLTEAPGELTIRFSEPITETFVAAHMRATESTSGASTTDMIREIELVAHRDPMDDHRLVVLLPELTDGLFRVRFVVRDGEDLHEVAGRTSFAVGPVGPPPPEPAPGAPPSPFEAASRWIFVSGLVLLAGVLTFRGRAPGLTTGMTRRLAVLAGAGLAAVVAGRVGVVCARALDLGIGLRSGLAHVGRTGEMRQLPVVALAALCTAPTVATRWLPVLDLAVVPGRRASFRWLVGWTGVVWLAMLAGSRDHSALLGPIEWEVAIAKTLHLIGLGMWLGVLVVALVIGGSRGGVLSALAAVKGPALAGAAIAVGSGMLLAGRLVVSITGLLSTQYGLLLVAKVALIVAAIVCGVVTHRRGPRFAMLEGTVLGAVVALGALMATAAPAVDHRFLPAASAAPPVEASVRADDLYIRLRAVPGRPGPNALEIQVSNTRRPAPAAIRRLEIGVRDGAAPVESVAPDDSGLALIPNVNLAVGETEVSITIVRDGLTSSSAVVTTRTAVQSYHAAVIVSSRPIRQPLRAAGALTLGIVATLIAIGKHRGRGEQQCVREPIGTAVS